MNSIKMLALSLILLCSLPINAFAIKKDSAWYDCQSTRDCTIEPGICGEPATLNRKFEKAYRAWVEETAPNVDCESFDTTWSAGACVQCKNSRCIPNPPEYRIKKDAKK